MNIQNKIFFLTLITLFSCNKNIDQSNLDINKKRAFGETPINQAITNKNNEALNLILNDPNLEINKKGKYGETPIDQAITKENNEALNLILNDPNLDINKIGKSGTPIELARATKNNEALKLIEEAIKKKIGKNLNQPSPGH